MNSRSYRQAVAKSSNDGDGGELILREDRRCPPEKVPASKWKIFDPWRRSRSLSNNQGRLDRTKRLRRRFDTAGCDECNRALMVVRASIFVDAFV